MSVPTTVGTIPTQTDPPSAVVSRSIVQYFTDADSTATKSYGATGLPPGLSLNTTTGAITGTPNTAGTYSVVLTCTPSAGSPESVAFDWIVAGVPTAALNYYINGSTGDETWDGLSATFVSGTNGPWATRTRANSVQPHASGHVDINVAPGTYRNQVYTPQYSGTDDTHRIRWRVTSNGIVDCMGPSSGRIGYDMYIGSAGTPRNYISFLQTSSTQRFRWDGEVVFGTGGGECEKNDDVQLFGHMDRMAYINGAGIVIEGAVRRTVGYNCIDFGDNTTGYVERLERDQHGTPYQLGGTDFGDWFRINYSTPVTNTFFFDGGTNGLSHNRSGHSGGLFYGGTGLFYKIASTGKFGTVATFSATDGNRAGIVTAQNARYVGIEQYILNGNGYPPDNSPDGAAELMKLEGRDNCLGDSILLDSLQHGLFMDSGDWSSYCSGNRICHTVFQNFGGPIFEMRDYLDDGVPGVARVNDFQMKNCIVDRIAQNEIASWTDLLAVIVLSAGVDWRNVVQMHGITIRDTRTLSQLYISITRGVSPPGTQTVQWFLDNYPNNFSNFTRTSSSLFTSERTFDTAITHADIATYFTPNTTADGVPLTVVSGSDTGSGTTLIVDDSRWLVDPQYGTGPTIHCNGANHTYTAINKATNTLTLSSGFSRTAGMAVNRGITTGSTPNRGAVR